MGHQGAFQRLERGEIELEQFYREFGEELSVVDRANEAYRKYCAKMKIRECFAVAVVEREGADEGAEVPTLPTQLAIDGKDVRRSPGSSFALADSFGIQLWTIMMAQASDPDDNILTAINLLRGPSILPSPLRPH